MPKKKSIGEPGLFLPVIVDLSESAAFPHTMSNIWAVDSLDALMLPVAKRLG